MKNSIIFYIVLLGAAFGGIKWTAHSILEKKKAALDKIDLHQQLEVNMGKDSLVSKIKGKNVALFFWDTENKPTVSDIKRLNDLSASHPNTQFIAVNASDGDDYATKFLKDKKVNFSFPLVFHPEWMNNLWMPIMQVYGSSEEEQNNGGSFSKATEDQNLLLFISKEGKIKQYYEGKMDDNKELEGLL